MAVSEALIQQVEHKRSGGSSICGYPCSLNCPVLRKMYMTKFIKQPENTGSPDPKIGEKSKHPGFLHCPCSFDHLSGSPVPETSIANNDVHIAPILPSAEKPAKKISKKKKKKKKSKPTKSLSEKVESEMGYKPCSPNSASSFKDEEDNSSSNGDRSTKYNSPTILTSLCSSEHEGDYSKDSSVLDNGKISNSAFKLISGILCNHLDAGTSTSCKVSNCSKQGPEGICADKFESLSFADSSHCKSEDSLNSFPEKAESDRLIQDSAVNKSRCCHNTEDESENRHLQQNRQKPKEGRTFRPKKSKPPHFNNSKGVGLLDSSFLVNHHSYSHEGLLSSPLVSSLNPDHAANRDKEMGDKEQGMPRGINGNFLYDSSRWVARHSPYQLVLQENQTNPREIDHGKLKSKSNYMLNLEIHNNRKKGVGGFKSNFFRLRNRSFQEEELQGHCELHYYKNGFARKGIIPNGQNGVTLRPFKFHSSACPDCKFSIMEQGIFNVEQPHGWMKLPTMTHTTRRPSLASIASEQGKFVSLEKPSFVDRNKDFASRTSVKKWIPVAKKDLSTSSIDSRNDLSHTTPISSTREKDQEGISISPYGPETLSEEFRAADLSSIETLKLDKNCDADAIKCNSLSGQIEGQSINECRENVAPNNVQGSTNQLLIGSQMALQALRAAYRLQRASERVELATGSPLAEFERLLHSAAPVVSSSYVLEQCAVCFDADSSDGSLCKHQIPDSSLSTVWNWYEKPTNYGLEVKAEDIQNLDGMTDRTPFHAHFVPLLSAVQLFGYPHLLDNHTNGVEYNSPDTLETGEIREQPVSSSDDLQDRSSLDETDDRLFQEQVHTATECALEEPVSVSQIRPCNGIDFVKINFFLICRIMELIKSGTSSPKIFGDPCNLECMKLHDLHPASWFSVAWYPIYRIPEGNFRASFLTYHSLGHLVRSSSLEDSNDKNINCVVSPVLGLQSYNAQGEYWFSPKFPDESSLKDLAPLNSSEILRERLRTLEENALLFARGYVVKGQVKVVNQQPDYEFFMSRKR
ncbi:Protein of unknown function DUF789 [Dillenia turbinata]|uniref:Uncharacterized protein n=1 Tax=Dillenia turbinata TaxID=194707 RepID=A0AAN8UNN4_9MAGN